MVTIMVVIMEIMEAMEILSNKLGELKMRLIKPTMFIVGLILVVVGSLGMSHEAKAYTDEEKAQAKAWLSAHGYSPDAGGAAAAYQDYLNGKFDEELGITREASTEARTQTAYDDSEDKEEKTTEEGEDGISSDSSSGNNTESSIWDIMGGTSEETDTEDSVAIEAATEEITEEAPSTQMAYEEPEDEEEPEEEKGEISLSDPGKKDEYREAAIVVVLSVLLCALLLGAFSLFRK